MKREERTDGVESDTSMLVSVRLCERREKKRASTSVARLIGWMARRERGGRAAAAWAGRKKENVVDAWVRLGAAGLGKARKRGGGDSGRKTGRTVLHVLVLSLLLLFGDDRRNRLLGR